jgi:hypothetical protein
MRAGVVAIMLLGMAAAVGCGGDSSGKMLVEYGRISNGIIEFRTDLRVREDGSASATSEHPAACPDGGKEVPLDDATMSRLRDALEAARLRSTPGNESGGVNAQTWEIRSGGVVWRWYGWAPLPPRVAALVAVLDRISGVAWGLKQ